MQQHISLLIEKYESGKINRRQLVAGLGSLVLLGGAGPLSARQTPQTDEAPTFRATGLNHIALRVTDVARSRDFYVKHLGLTVTRDGRQSCFLDCGKHFLALFRSNEAAMDHYCYSIDDYDVDECEAKLKAVGIKPRVVRPDGRIYFDDPDGLEVQLANTPR